MKGWIEQSNDPKMPFEHRRAAFEQALGACPSQLGLYRAFSLLLLEHRDFDLALHWIRRGLQLAPSNSDLKLDLSVALLATGHTHEALNILKPLPANPKVEFYRGMAYQNLGDHQAARQAFADAFAQGYEDPYVLYVLIAQDRILGDKQAGLSHFRIFDERFPNSPYLHMLLGDAYLTKDQKGDAENEYRQALKLDPAMPVVNFRLGHLEFQKARYAEAADFFRREIQLSPSFAESYLYLGACLHRLGQDNTAIPVLQQAITRNPGSRLAYRELAATQLEANHPDTAWRVLQTALKRFPDDQALHGQLAQLLAKIGHVEQAKQEAQLAQRFGKRNVRREQSALGSLDSVNTNLGAGRPLIGEASKSILNSAPRNPGFEPGMRDAERPAATPASPHPPEIVNPLLDRAHQCLARADSQCAVAALNEVRDEELRQTPGFLRLQARTLALQHHYSEALEVVNLALQKDPDRVEDVLLEGELYQKLGDQVSAVRAFLRSHELDPRSPVPVYSIGMSFFAFAYYNDDGQYYDRAARHFRLAVQLDPRFSKAEFMVGVGDVIRFALHDAKPHFERAIQLDPDNAYYHLHYGVLLTRLGDDSQGLRELQLAEKLDPHYALTHFSLGHLLLSLRRYEDARLELENAVRLNPNLANAYYCLGTAYHHLGLNEMSRQAYQRFQAIKHKEKAPDPVEATLASSEMAAGTKTP